MESYYSSLHRTRSSDHESYYRTPEYGPEDIICPGSDNEETPEETRRKRLRYEAQARRYMRGHRPVLLSASLRGPLSQESGWVNPWNRPGTKRDQDGLRKRPAFTSSRAESHSSKNINKPTGTHGGQKERGAGRERVTQRERGISSPSRLADREPTTGMGYANPAEVMAWQANAIVEGEDIIDESHLSSDPTKQKTYGDQNTTIFSQDHPAGEIADLSEARQADSMVNNYVKTPHAAIDSDFTRGTKRARDSQWLKGSYVSKRARWNGPVHSSPTPAPESAAFKTRERRHVSAGSAAQRKPHLDSCLPAANLQRSKSERPPSTPSSRPVIQANSVFSAQDENQMGLSLDTTGMDLFSIRISSRSEQYGEDQDMDELRDASQGSKPTSRRSFGKRSRRSLTKSMDRSLSDQDDLVVITPGPGSSRSRASDKRNVPPEVNSATLPRLHPPSGINDFDFCENSFVSEVAPSSRDLEQFHFKRKRRTKSSQYETSGVEDVQDVVPDITITEAPPRNVDEVSIEMTSPGHNEHDEQQHYFDTELLMDVKSIGGDEVPGDVVSFQDHPNNVEVAGVEKVREDPKDSDSLGDEDMGNAEDLGSLENLEDVQDLRDDIDGQQTKAVAYLKQSQSNRTPYSETKRLLLEDKSLPSDRNNGDVSWNIGDMSFLRAVLRAGGSTNNTPSNGRDLIPEPEMSPRSSKEPQETSHHFDYLAKLNCSASRSTPIAPPRGQTPLRSHSPRSPPSEGPVRDCSHHSVPLSISKTSRPEKSETILPSEGVSVSPEEEEDDHSNHFPEPKSSPPQQHRSSSSPQAVPQKPAFSQRSEPSQDPNDFSIQSYNTTPFRSQRSARPPRSARLSKLSEPQGLGELSASNVLELAEGRNTMDMIQLELSQACHSSSQQSEVPHDGDEEADDAVKAISDPGLKEEDMIHSTVAKALATSDQAIDFSEASRESSEPVFHPKTTLLNDQGSEEQPEQPERPRTRTRSPEIVLDECSEHADMNTEANTDQLSSEEASEASWEGCGPQSPWAIEHNEPILVHATTRKEDAELSISSPLEREQSVLEPRPTERENDDDISSGWEHLERPQMPENGVINPFTELISPSDSPKPEPEPEEVIPIEALTSTQLLVEAATTNPWASSLKKPASLKKSKRVSFVKPSLDAGEDSQESQLMPVRFGPASPPPPEPLHEENMLNNGTTTASKFENHFNRQYKRLLPENVASPMGSSPALAAQAEAFIAADRDASIEQEASTFLKTPTRLPKARSEAESNAAWTRQEGLDVLFPSLSRIVRTPSPVSTSLAGFDMADALGDAGNFLEDWSVDSELKKARGSDTDTSRRNGVRRTRLFGFV